MVKLKRIISWIGCFVITVQLISVPLALITLVVLIAVTLTKLLEEKKRQKEEIENLKQRIHELEKDR